VSSEERPAKIPAKKDCLSILGFYHFDFKQEGKNRKFPDNLKQNGLQTRMVDSMCVMGPTFRRRLSGIRYQESGDRNQISQRRLRRQRKIHEAGKMPTLPECIGWGERSDAQHLAAYIVASQPKMK
jgi:hypothetical protein